MTGRYKRTRNFCKCGNEVPFSRFGSKYCSEACRDKYGKPMSWYADMDPERKADTALKDGTKWAAGHTKEQLIHWYRARYGPSLIDSNLLSGRAFMDAFDREFNLMYAEIVGLMYRIQRYGKKEESPAEEGPTEKA